jgi:hypothetical protein
MNEPVDWLWYGEDESSERHISFGRWQRHHCQHRYKLAVIQPTEWDHYGGRRQEAARILEMIAAEGLPHPRNLDAALDALEDIYRD